MGCKQSGKYVWNGKAKSVLVHCFAITLDDTYQAKPFHLLQFIGASSFNQDLSSWNTESLTSSENMFQEATSFDLNNSPKIPTLKPTLVPTRNPTQQPTTSSPTTSNPTVSPTIDTSNCYMLDISIRLDQYPADTRWEIIPKGQKGAVATSPPYDSSMQNQAVEVESICLEEGTYDFIIYDVYGDGM